MMLKPISLLGITFLGAGVILVGLILQTAHAQPQAAYAQAAITPTPIASAIQRTVSVTGTGLVNAQPDEAILILGVQTDAKTASEAMSENSKQMQAVVDALRKANIASADIQTQTLQLTPRIAEPTPQPQGQVQPQATPQSTPESRILGYTATNTVQVTVRKLDNLGVVLDQVVSAGSNTIQSISFDLSNQSQFTDQAREAAMKDALHKAQQLASLANVKLGTVVSINENSNAPLPFQAALAAPRSAVAVPISPGTQAITVMVQVTWELQP